MKNNTDINPNALIFNFGALGALTGESLTLNDALSLKKKKTPLLNFWTFAIYHPRFLCLPNGVISEHNKIFLVRPERGKLVSCKRILFQD